MFKTLDLSVLLAYLLTILSFLLCLIYGILNWNKGSQVTQVEAEEEERWEKEEKDIDRELSGNP